MVPMIDLPLAPAYYLDALPIESKRLADAARKAGLEASVPTCPGWDVAKLLVHVGVVHRWVATMVSGGLTERFDHRLVERAPDGEERITWFERGSAELVTALDEAGVGRPVWTLAGLGHTQYWYRRMVQETLMHRLDAGLAAGVREDTDPSLAADGIDEYWTDWIARELRQRPIDALHGTLSFRASDVDATWTVSLARDGVGLLGPGSPAEVRVTGPSFELLSFLWNRGQLSKSTVVGDRELIDNWVRLVQL
jgi:uncharacterized protein (TIGR03083 family)